jgi:peptidyl-prolyl cis-trans isomerase D
MLDTIRRAQPSIIKAVLAAVVIAFVATIFLDWGWQRPGRSAAPLATVGGEAISLTEFEMTYNGLVDTYRRVYRDQFTEDLARAMNLKQLALENLMQRKLIIHEAKRQGLTVTDAELVDKVQAYPVFQVDGRFDRTRYLQVLRLSRLTPAEFEQNQREEILMTKLEHLIKGGVQVTESEVKHAFMQERERINVAYVRLNPERYRAQVEVNDSDLMGYFQGHQERFRKPEQVRVAYLAIDPAAFSAELEITEERLAQYYEEHKEEFRQEEQVRARHILFKLGPQPTAEEETRARAEAEAALKRIQDGRDFAQVAQQLSQDPASAQEGGDLGFFKRGEMVKPFEDVAFALSPGEMSDPIRSDFGFHLIKVEEVQEGGYRALETVRDELRARWLDEESRRRAEMKAQEVRALLAGGAGEWETVAREHSLTPRETPLLSRGQAVEGIENTAMFTQAAFALQEGEVSQPVAIGKQFMVLKLLERIPSYIPTFEDIGEAVRGALVQERAMVLARQHAEALLAEVRAGKSLDDVAQILSTQAAETGLFSRNSAIPGFGRPQPFMSEAFRMRLGDVRIADLGNQPALVMLKEREEPDPEVYATEQTQLRQRVLRQRRDQVFSEWLEAVRRRAEEQQEITINQSVMAVL